MKPVLVIIFFYFLVPYLVWTKTSWSKAVKIGITVACIAVFLAMLSKQQTDTKNAANKVKIAEAEIKAGNIEKALVILNEAQELDANNDKARTLKKQIEQYNDDKLLDKALTEMTNDEYGQLLRGELKKKYIPHESLNSLFIVRLKDNGARRSQLTKAAYEKKKKEKAAKRKKQIEAGFSSWDGAHIKLTALIKESMNDPESFKHAETTYRDMGDYLLVTETFRGKNAFGGVVKNTVTAKCSIDGDVLEVIEQH